ncbi:nicotinate-nucleotide adenylyltransferase [Craterilacuibacter sinensis]|uniref:Probable nicotinate-nucleotide adenylyltransferase n=1 Tax=Craterilacuibacter sinensis TaxID=2686017 RepID=A0A845BL63_9NEIS|nr:nicotinate-nucleotide adenylyltransferase [Craterilacuibacter sinensis]MXR36024.1 nicotinate-nucleotide adenylyltransferase [Craterilacuibacter sinensis]RQW28311.1 nicotinate-nucleotide adenylyltransferase [Rhodobacteraceae bacterium CH30]
MRRIGLYGGTFDPFHCAHLRLACALRDELKLDEVRLVPAGLPYHRDHGPHASASQRLDMVRLAIAGEPGLIADDREIRRGKNAYTVETLEELRSELTPQDELWCLIGGDSLARLASWHRWQAIFTLANLAVALRPGFDPAHLAPAISAQWQARQVSDFSKRTPSGTIRALTLAPVDVSATDIRARLAAGADVSGLVPAAVLDYIRAQQLYRNT